MLVKIEKFGSVVIITNPHYSSVESLSSVASLASIASLASAVSLGSFVSSDSVVLSDSVVPTVYSYFTAFFRSLVIMSGILFYLAFFFRKQHTEITEKSKVE